MKKNRILIILTVAALAVCLGVTGTLAAGQIVKSSSISRETAGKIALADADVREKDAVMISSSFERRSGIYLYTIEFETENGLYQYVINAKTGQIMEKAIPDGAWEGSPAETASEPDASDPGQSSRAAGYISVEQAKETALTAAGVSQSEAVFSKAKIKKDDGFTVFEIEFFVKEAREYEYKIDAVTGRILDDDEEPYDDDGDYPAPSPSETPSPRPSKEPVPSGSPDPEDDEDNDTDISEPDDDADDDGGADDADHDSDDDDDFDDDDIPPAVIPSEPSYEEPSPAAGPEAYDETDDDGFDYEESPDDDDFEDDDDDSEDDIDDDDEEDD